MIKMVMRILKVCLFLVSLLLMFEVRAFSYSLNTHQENIVFVLKDIGKKTNICGIEFYSTYAWGYHLDLIFWEKFSKQLEIEEITKEGQERKLEFSFINNYIVFTKKLSGSDGPFTLELKLKDKEKTFTSLLEEVFNPVLKDISLDNFRVIPLVCKNRNTIKHSY